MSESMKAPTKDTTIPEISLITEGETLATDEEKRRRVAQQPRDKFGRWISKGANVKWREEGKSWAGVVSGIEDGNARVDLSGTNENKLVNSSKLKVLASKATLPSGSAEYKAGDKNFEDTLGSEDFQNELNNDKDKTISRNDGYSLEVHKEEDEDGGNPILYQLFAPNGRSLGKYSAGAESDFDAMAEDYENGAEETTSEDATGAEGPVVASSDIIIEGSMEPKPYRVPASVRDEIASALSELSTVLSDTDLEIPNRLVNEESVSRSDIEWIGQFFTDITPEERLRGGFKGRKWASKILSPENDIEFEENTRYIFDDEIFEYYAVGSHEHSTLVHNLIAIDFVNGDVYEWGLDGFHKKTETSIESIDEPQLILLDEITAERFARAIDNSLNTGSDLPQYDILDFDPVERNLFDMAEAEMDYEELDRFSAIIADATGYTPVERSINASRQKRGPMGRFGGEQTPTDDKLSEAYSKARLDEELPLVEDPAARIAEWLSTAEETPVVAAGEVEGETPVETESEPDEGVQPNGDTLYFAIVDDVDKTAVMNAIAITKEGQEAQAWLRENASWQLSPDVLADLEGATPPPVVELDVPDPAKSVLAQIDAHDSNSSEEESEEAVTASAKSKKQREEASKKGYALPDGSYPINNVADLKNAVKAFGRAKESEKDEVKRHIKKRARALNRKDLIPENWREASAIERGEEIFNQSPIYGTYGEVIIAAGIPGIADTPSDFRNVARLKRYWSTGPGAAKIRWGTPGDLTRCHRNLTKYIGSDDSWGYCQNLHISIFGRGNPESGG